MSASKKSAGLFVIQIAMAILLVILGIMTLQLNTGDGVLGNMIGSAKANISGNEIASAVYSLLGAKSPIAKPLIIVLGICEMLGGIFLGINLFLNTGKLENLFLLIILVMWILVIVLVDVLGNAGITKVNWQSANAILSYFKNLANHLLILGALLSVMNRG